MIRLILIGVLLWLLLNTLLAVWLFGRSPSRKPDDYPEVRRRPF